MFFHEHAPFAVKALEAGRHVMSETACNTTLTEGGALCRAVERTGLTYMLAENYPYTAFNQEMRRVYRTGEIGEVTYAEGEYNHPMSVDSRLRIAPGLNHWRNWLPSTYYCTHALAPLIYITDTRPVRIFGLLLPGHSNWYRVHGTRGAMEALRGPGYFGSGQVRVWHEEWDLKPGEVTDRAYVPEWPEHGEVAKQGGHGGGDFWTSFHFANAIRSGQPSFLDVYRGVAMSSVGILAWKSALEDGRPFDMPDFRDEASRQTVADDHWSPWPEHTGPGQPPPSIAGLRQPTAEGLAHARSVWRQVGHEAS